MFDRKKDSVVQFCKGYQRAFYIYISQAFSAPSLTRTGKEFGKKGFSVCLKTTTKYTITQHQKKHTHTKKTQKHEIMPVWGEGILLKTKSYEKKL